LRKVSIVSKVQVRNQESDVVDKIASPGPHWGKG